MIRFTYATDEEIKEFQQVNQEDANKTWFTEIVEVEVINHRLVGSILRQRRTSKGISLRCIAQQLNVSAMYLSDLERGKRNWRKKLHDKYLIAVGDNSGK